ncbi:hypothetical protein ACFL21_03095 [Patescibacteria group bacterium]
MIPKIIKIISLSLATAIYLFILILIAPSSTQGLFQELWPTIKILSFILGIFGIIGIWLLVMVEKFDNKNLKTPTLIFTICGILSALGIAFFSFAAGLMPLSGALLIFAVIMVVYLRVKLFG